VVPSSTSHAGGFSTSGSPSGVDAHEAAGCGGATGVRAWPPRLAPQPKARPGGRVDAAKHDSWLGERARLEQLDTLWSLLASGRNHPSVRSCPSGVCISRYTGSASPDTYGDMEVELAPSTRQTGATRLLNARQGSRSARIWSRSNRWSRARQRRRNQTIPRRKRVGARGFEPPTARPPASLSGGQDRFK